MADVFSVGPMSGATKAIEREKAAAKAALATAAGSAFEAAPTKGDNTKQLRNYIDRIIRLEEEKKATADEIKEIYAEVKSAGHTPKAVRIIVKREMEDAQQKAAREAVENEVELMTAALGDFADSPLGTAAMERARQ